MMRRFVTRKRGAARIGLVPVVAIALSALLLSSLPALAEVPQSICRLPEEERPEVPDEPTELCATTTISGGEAGVIRVRLPVDATLSLAFGPEGGIDIPVESVADRSFAGFALVEHRALRDGNTPVVFAGRFASRFGGAAEWAVFNLPSGSDGVELPADDYLLYLLPDDEEVTITLRFGGLEEDGHVELTPRRPTQFTVAPLTTRLGVDAARHLYSAGDAREINENRGFFFQRMAFRSTNHSANLHGQCLIDGDPEDEQAAPVAYAPGCPNAFINQPQVGTSPPTAPNYQQRMFQSGLVPAGTWGLQSWWGAAGQEVHEHGALGLWLSFDE